MLSRGLRVSFVVGILLVLLAIGLHTVLRLHNAPETVEFGLLNTFVATFASIILTFFAGALVADHQIEKETSAGPSGSKRCWTPSYPRSWKSWTVRP